MMPEMMTKAWDGKSIPATGSVVGLGLTAIGAWVAVGRRVGVGVKTRQLLGLQIVSD